MPKKPHPPVMPRPKPYLATIPPEARTELDALLSEFILADHEKSQKLLLKALNSGGFRSDDTLKAVDTLQRRLAVKPTLYTRLTALADRHLLRAPVKYYFGRKRRRSGRNTS